MPRDRYDDPLSPMIQPAGSGRRLLLGGVAVACGLGVGLGLWARPAPSERRLAAAPAAPMAVAARRELQIVVDDPKPPPLPLPLPAIPAEAVPPTPEATPSAARPRLVSVVATPRLVQSPPARRLARLEAPARPAAAAARIPGRARPARIILAKVIKPPTLPMPAKKRPRVARAAPQQGPKAASKARLLLARAPARRPEHAAKPLRAVVHVQAAKPRPRLEKVRLVREAPVRAVKARPLRIAAAVPPARKPEPKTRARWSPPMRAQRPASAPTARPVGLMKVSNPQRCASLDPGAALVCATPSLGAADRQMSRAFRDARAAGVPDWRLQQEHQRWLAARAAAAREAPWAVHDVYQARIAELNGLTHDAQGGN